MTETEVAKLIFEQVQGLVDEIGYADACWAMCDAELDNTGRPFTPRERSLKQGMWAIYQREEMIKALKLFGATDEQIAAISSHAD